jgi:hypothetical protein
MIEFVPAREEHIRAVALGMRPRDLAELSAVSYVESRQDAADVLAGRYADHPNVECALWRGEPVAIGGLLWTRPNVASLLFYATPAFPKVVVGLTRYIQVTALARAKAHAHRIECFSLSTYAEMRQWVESFGLEREATLRQFGRNGEDFIVYAWLRSE